MAARRANRWTSEAAARRSWGLGWVETARSAGTLMLLLSTWTVCSRSDLTTETSDASCLHRVYEIDLVQKQCK